MSLQSLTRADQESLVISKVIGLLVPLSHEQRWRILRSVCLMLDVSPMKLPADLGKARTVKPESQAGTQSAEGARE